MAARLTLVTILVALAYAGLVAHLYRIQLLNGRYYVARAETQYLGSQISKAERGTIYFTDRNGNRLPAVSNKDLPLIFAVPKVIEDAKAAAHMLAAVFDANEAELAAKFSKKNDTYELLMRRAPALTAAKVSGFSLKGVYVTDVPERYYPFGRVASHILGYVGPDTTGTGESGHYGLEEYYDTALRGASSTESGENVTLTIDPNIQIEAERVLQKLLTEHKGKGGSVIVEEPKTGRILAMASTPSFDPNAYAESSVADFLNPVTQKVYEPGSVMKLITMAAGIDAGKITPETTMYDSGSLTLNGKKIQNWDMKAHGRVTMTNVIELSINVGAAFAERQIGDQLFKNYLVKFGFTDKTGIDLPGELRGDVRNLAPHAAPITFATASFGQGVAVTQIEMLQAIAAIANKGVLMRPYLNADLLPKPIRQVVSEHAADEVTSMMVSAVDKAEIAKISGYSIAGKTGTAQVPDFVHGGYSENVIDTYIGFGPTSDPKFILLIKLSEPEGAPHAAETVVPAFHDLAQFILNYYNVPPDRLGAAKP